MTSIQNEAQAELDVVSISADPNSKKESTPLLSKSQYSLWAILKHRFKTTRKVVTSKAALTILLWSFVVSMPYYLILDPWTYTQLKFFQNTSVTNIIEYGAVASIFCFYPIAGYLADNKYCRYKTIVSSLWLLIPSVVFLAIYISGVLVANVHNKSEPEVAFTILLSVVAILLAITTVTFYSNIIQLGMDQLYEFPAEDQSLFIHWYIWVLHFTTFLVQLLRHMALLKFSPFNKFGNISSYRYVTFVGIGISSLLSIFFVIAFFASLYISQYRKNWFLIESTRVNPYKLVFLVSRFAWNHKVPVNRSSFTYFEDDIPSGLNLAKDKYGGPFSTEQVEDVKVFYEILKVLISLGPIFFLNYSADVTLYVFTLHGTIFNISYPNGSSLVVYNSDPVKVLLIHNGILTPLTTAICIPLHLFLIRPFFFNYIPGMLKRMGIGGVVMVLSLMCTVAIGAWAHTRYEVGCMFDVKSLIKTVNSTATSTPGPFYDTSFVAIQRVLLSLSNMFIYIGLYEFVCSQSPHSMRGLLIGLLFAIKGVFYTMAAATALPFDLAMDHNSHISCGVAYYSLNSGVGVVAVVAYTLVARKYKYRERDEPFNIYRYIENYYSKEPPPDDDEEATDPLSRYFY